MNVFQAERETIAGKLTAAGVDNVTLDPRGQLPCVLVGLPRVVGPEGVGGWTVEFPVQILGTPPGDADAAAWMLDQLEPVLVEFPGIFTAEPGSVTRNDSEVPAYTVALSRSVDNPNC